MLNRNNIKKIIYPAILFIFIAATAVIFFKVAQFLSKNIDRVFYDPAEQSANSLLTDIDFPKLLSVADKLGITINLEAPVEQAPEPQNQDIATSTSPEQATSTQIATSTSIIPVPTIDKTLLKIAVLNSTKTKGLAGELKNLLTAAGFNVLETKNWAQLFENTLIKIKEDKKIYIGTIDEIKEIVSEKYASAEIQTLEESSKFDIEIIIGAK